MELSLKSKLEITKAAILKTAYDYGEMYDLHVSVLQEILKDASETI